MTDRDFIVPPLSRRKIREVTDLVRKVFGVTTACVDIVTLVERQLPKVDEGFFLDVVDCEEMGDVHGLAMPRQKVIRLREDVYERACDGRGRDRMTMAHELGHYILHRSPMLAEVDLVKNIPIYSKPEWQANTFAGELLVSHQHIGGCLDVGEMASRFNVTSDAARVQWQVFEKEGLLKQKM